MLLTLVFNCLAFCRARWVWTFRVGSCFVTPNAYLIFARTSVALLLRDLYQISCTLSVGSIAKSHQTTYSSPYIKSARPPSCVKFSTLTPKMLLLPSIVASHYENSYTDGSTSAGNYGYRSYLGISLEEPTRTTRREQVSIITVSLPAGIWTKHIHSTSLQR
jgi:hypothetical protein